MLLTEMIIKEEKRYKLDYLTEYLVVTESISVKEAKQFLNILEKMHQDVVGKADKWYKKALKALTDTYNNRIKIARDSYKKAKAAGKSEGIINKIMIKIDNLKQEFSMKKNNLVKRLQKMKANIGDKIRGSEKLVKMKASLNKIPKKGKIGLAAGGLTAGALSYAAYRAKRKRDAALKNK